MRKFYTQMLVLLALVVSGSAFGQAVTGLTVSPGPYCPNTPVQISWTNGSGGGGFYTVDIDTIAPMGFGISHNGTLPSSPFLFSPGVAGATYYITVYGQSGVKTYTQFTYQTATYAPTGFNVNGIANGKICPGDVTADLEATGGNVDPLGAVRWYSDNTYTTLVHTGNPWVGAPTTFPYYVRYEACDTSAGITVNPGTYTSPSAAATNYIANPATFCAGTPVTFTTSTGNAGDNPLTDTIFSTDGTVGGAIANPYTFASAETFANFYVIFVDGCAVMDQTSADLGPVTAGTTPVEGTLSNNGVAPICPGNTVNFQAAGYTLGGGSFEFSVDTGATWNPVTTTMDSQDIIVSTTVQVAFRVNAACGISDSSVSTVVVSVPSADLDSVTASATQVCAGTNVTFQAYGAAPTANGYYEYQINGGGWVNNGPSSSVTIPVSVPTVVDFHIVDDCTPLGNTTTSSPNVDVATANVEPTTLTPDDAGPVCSGTLVTWTSDGTLSDYVANPAVFQFSTTGFADTAQSGTSNIFAMNVSANTTVSVRIVGGCAPSGTIVTNTVNVQAGSTAPTDLTAEDAFATMFAANDSVCAQNITLTAVGYTFNAVDNGMVDFGTVSNGVFTSISGPQTTNTYTLAFSADANYAVEYTSNCISSPNVIDSIQLYAAIDNTNSTSLDITDAMSNVVADGSTICSNGVYNFVMTGGVLGTGATYQFTYIVDGGAPVVINPSTDSLVLDMDILNPTTSLQVSAAIVGGCTDYSAMGYTVNLNFIGTNGGYSNIVADADNFCANAGVTVNITASGATPAASANTVWYELDQTNNIVGMIQSNPATASSILTVAPVVTTTYGVRIEGCDTSAFAVHTVLVKALSVAPTAIGVSPNDTVCPGATVALTANGGQLGAAPAFYEWADASNTVLGTGNPFFVNVNADMQVKVRAISGCDTSAYTALQDLVILTNTSVDARDTTICANTVLDLNLLVTPAGGSFAGTGVTGSSFTSATAGSFSIVYTKSFGSCMFSDNMTVTVLSVPTAVAGTIDTASCAGNDGAFEISATGGAGGDYDFSNGFTTTSGNTANPYTFAGLSSGSYTAFAIDANGCQSANITVVVPNASGLSLDSYGVTPVSCYGLSNGSIFAVTSGGLSPITYALSNDYGATWSAEQSSGTFTNLPAQVDPYYIRYTDAAGCYGYYGDYITEPSNPVDLTVDYYSDVTCFGGTDGKIVNIFGSGGTAPYEYSINGSAYTTQTSYTDLTAGTYVITVKDQGACEADFTFSIESPEQIVADVAIVDYTQADGYDIKITRTGGTGSLQIKLNNGDFTLDEDFTNLAPGVYTYVIQDNNGCTISGEFTLEDPSSVGSVSKDIQYTLYPNPFSGNLTLKGEIAATAEVTMVDIYGKTIAVEVVRNGETATINTESLAKGMYIVNISANGQTASSKVIKN